MELNKITKCIDNIDCDCHYPINSYVLYSWIIILLILIYLLFEYFQKKI